MVLVLKDLNAKFKNYIISYSFMYYLISFSKGQINLGRCCLDAIYKHQASFTIKSKKYNFLILTKDSRTQFGIDSLIENLKIVDPKGSVETISIEIPENVIFVEKSFSKLSTVTDSVCIGTVSIEEKDQYYQVRTIFPRDLCFLYTILHDHLKIKCFTQSTLSKCLCCIVQLKEDAPTNIRMLFGNDTTFLNCISKNYRNQKYNLIYLKTSKTKEQVYDILGPSKIETSTEVSEIITENVLYINNLIDFDFLEDYICSTFFSGFKIVDKGVYSEIHGNRNLDLSFLYYFLTDYLHLTCSENISELPIVKFTNPPSELTDRTLKDDILLQICPNVSVNLIRTLENREIHVLVESIEDRETVIQSTNGGLLNGKVIKSESLGASEQITNMSFKQPESTDNIHNQTNEPTVNNRNYQVLLSSFPPDYNCKKIAQMFNLSEKAITIETAPIYPEFWCDVDENQKNYIFEKINNMQPINKFIPYAHEFPSNVTKRLFRRRIMASFLCTNFISIIGFSSNTSYCEVAKAVKKYGNIKFMRKEEAQGQIEFRIAFETKLAATKAFENLTSHNGKKLTVSYFTMAKSETSTDASKKSTS
ncbi:hypothetical protein TRFO_25853 [Tritrichomonas foetus]|uniref:RRM domain-containing protein n=1 Tax=Tritrichomonas foetus TaxID=1144522 RepID=A0A1J4K598_9EUKA|nr:hypothetical protein TRFO_25853 [Tritrichomonas foetus]|eukprot:OHT06162.1 hypothetical protein TRFO_25853 [Tritrichomonas foetus]